MMEKIFNKFVGFQRDTVEDIDWKAIWRQLKWMNGFSKGYRGRIGILTGISTFFMIIGVAYAYVYKYIIDWVTTELQGIITFITETAATMKYTSLWDKVMIIVGMLPPWAIWVGLGFVLYKLVNFTYSVLLSFFQLRLSMDLGLGIKRQVYTTILESDWLKLTSYRAGDLVTRVANDADTISTFAMTTVPNLIVQALQFVVAFGALVYMDWTLTFFAFVGVPIYLFVVKLKGKRTRDYQKRSLELGAKNQSYLYESMANLMVIKSFMLVPEFIKRYHQIHKDMFDLAVEKKKYSVVTGLVLSAVSQGLGVLVLIFLGTRLIDGYLTIGTLVAFQMLRPMVSGPIDALMGMIVNSIEISASAERVLILYDLPRDRTQIPDDVLAFAEQSKQDGMGLAMKDLAFDYIKGDTTLKNVNIEVHPGETIALVGPSGEGKTTLIRLALGLLTPDQGTAYLTSANGEKLELSVETRAFFSYVPQGNTMFSGTIRENMQLGKDGATDEEIRRALKLACIITFVDAQSEGLNTFIGERGVGISEGQAQRFAIARALLRGAPILLLDEATSALDIYTEKAILDNIFKANLCRTCILTTHRPSVFTICDRIYAVRNKSVELIKQTRDEEVTY